MAIEIKDERSSDKVSDLKIQDTFQFVHSNEEKGIVAGNVCMRVNGLTKGEKANVPFVDMMTGQVSLAHINMPIRKVNIRMDLID